MGMVNFVTVGPPKELLCRLREAHGLTTFVETGTYKGQTAVWASKTFDRVITVEGSEDLYREVTQKHGHVANIEFICGDSREKLAWIVTRLRGPAVFWLDAHWCGGSAYGQTAQCPILDEIRAINSSPYSHFLFIDDARYFVAPPPSPHPVDQWPDIRAVIHELNACRDNRYTVIHDDVIISVPSTARDSVVQYCRNQYTQALEEHKRVTERPGCQATRPMAPSETGRKLPALDSAGCADPPRPAGDTLQRLVEQGLWQQGHPLRLHLGCGARPLPGYVNVDYPPSQHEVIDVRADLYEDIADLSFPATVVDEIRLHHVFEHFSRVIALVLLVRWHQWLKVGGYLLLETPDVMESARALVSDVPWAVRMGAIRHLVGDQSAGWGYHRDLWFAERFKRTLTALGFEFLRAQATRWPKEPYLCNIQVVARKARDVPMETQIPVAERLLWESTVSPKEKPTWEVWCRQLRTALSAAAGTQTSRTSDWPTAAALQVPQILSQRWSRLPLEEIHNFNQWTRNRWVQAKARGVPAGARVLDVGAGTCPYRDFFSHCDYRTQDFKGYADIRKDGDVGYGHIDYVSDITEIPVPDASFDVVLCTEVLEHVPEPVLALKETARILRPGGRLLLTAPLGSGLHQLPYHYYGGMSRQWYVHFLDKFGLELREITPNGGFFKLLAQECARVAWTMPQHQHLHGEYKDMIRSLFGEWLPRYLFALEDRCFIDQFTVGYHVEAVKAGASDIARTGPADGGQGA